MREKELEKQRGNGKRTVSMEFLASISHEIRNPVNVIVGLIHLLKSSEKEEEKQKYTQELVKISDVLLELVNNIMDYSKVDAGKLNYEFTSVDLKESIIKNLAGYKTLAAAKDLDLIIQISDQLPGYVYTDPVKINQVILNLISNSLKFTEKGYIKLMVEVGKIQNDEVTVKFEIEDTGQGISGDKLETIFNAFEQGSNEINLKFGGTGLGLSICKQVVSVLGGDLLVQSQVGLGTKFSFTLELPISKSDSKPAVKSNYYNVNKLEKGKTVLIVDDSDLNTMLIHKTLEKEGFKTLVAASAMKAIKILQQEKVDLVLLDIHMPGMDGIEAAGVIKDLQGLDHLPIIAVTGSTDLSSLKNLETAVFSDFILKPFHPEELVQKSKAAIAANEILITVPNQKS